MIILSSLSGSGNVRVSYFKSQMFLLLIILYICFKTNDYFFRKITFLNLTFGIRDVTFQYFLFDYRYSVLNIYLYFNIVLPL